MARSTDRSPLREDWLAHALSTAPADRPAAEEAVGWLYAATGRPPPEFVWVRSPAEAATVLPAKDIFRYRDNWQTVEAQIAALVSDLRHRRPRGDWQGAPSRREGELRRIVRAGLIPAINSTMPGSLGIGWAGRHDAGWLAELDASDLALLDEWVTLTRSAGWWWPREEVCVMPDRPTVVHVDANSLLHNDNGPAITFADGTHAYAWHGTTVPRWVIEEPDVVRIMTERHLELRFAAAERLGWETYVEQATTPLIATAPDPGNPGFDLRTHRWQRDPLDAAATTYGLRADQYAQLLRRT